MILACISSNVSAVYDDFATRISETVGFAGLQNCGGEKFHKGAKRRLVFFVARAANGGEAYTVLLCAGLVFYI